MKNFLSIIIIVIFSITTISCSKKEDSELSESTTSDNSSSDNSSSDNSSSDNSSSDNISISSSADNETVVFGQTYQYEFTTSGGTSSDNLTYSLSNGPDNMTISSTGLVEWTPTKSSDIKTHENIKITVTTASGQTLTQIFDLVVTGTCVSGNVLAIWSGDQRISIDSSKFLGNITAYTDNASSVKTVSQNYNYSSASVNLTHGPQATVNDGAMFFYNQYDNTTHSYLFYFFGMETGGAANIVGMDVFVSNNASQDGNPVDDDPGETDLISQSQSATTGLYTSAYKGRYKYSANSDGAVIGPFSNTDNQTLLDNGTTFKVFVDLSGTSSLNTSTYYGISTGLQLGDLDSMKYYSKDNSTILLGNHDNFTIGYKTSVTCE